MGIFNFINRSYKKTKLMRKMIDVIEKTCFGASNNESDRKVAAEGKEAVFKEFFKFISEDNMLGTILREHNVSYDKFNSYIHLMCRNGFRWYKGRYIPVDVFSFAREMKYFLTAIEKGEKIELIYLDLIEGNF